MKRVLFCALCTICLLSPVKAQTDYVVDNAGQTTGGIWTEVGATKVLPYNLSLGLDVGFRTNQWFDEASRYDIGLGLGWKPTKHWKFGVGYTFVMKHTPQETAHKSEIEQEYKYRAPGDTENTNFTEFLGAPNYTDPATGTTYTYKGYNDDTKNYTRITDSYWRPKHRINVDAAYTYRFWKTLRVSLRERYQLTLMPANEVNRTRTGTKSTMKYRDPSYDIDGNLSGYDEVEGPVVTPANEETVKEKSSKTLHTLRSRLTFEIDKKDWDVTPYAYCELFNDLGNSFHTDKVRASAGIEYAVAKQHRLQLGYLFNHEKDDDGDQNIHAIVVGYNFKF